MLFIFSLHWMNTPENGPRGVLAGVAGMTLADSGDVDPAADRASSAGSCWLIAGDSRWAFRSRWFRSPPCRSGRPCHTRSAVWRRDLSERPKFYLWSGEGSDQLTHFRMCAIVAEVILGFLTLTGSLMAAANCRKCPGFRSGR